MNMKFVFQQFLLHSRQFNRFLKGVDVRGTFFLNWNTVPQNFGLLNTRVIYKHFFTTGFCFAIKQQAGKKYKVEFYFIPRKKLYLNFFTKRYFLINLDCYIMKLAEREKARFLFFCFLVDNQIWLFCLNNKKL